MRIRGLGEKAEQAHIRANKDFAAFLGRSPDTATSEELRAYQPHMPDAGVTPSTFAFAILHSGQGSRSLRRMFGSSSRPAPSGRSSGSAPS